MRQEIRIEAYTRVANANDGFALVPPVHVMNG
jgi:hypothetical protein